MPKKPRTPEEIQEVKQSILDKALELINEDGYNNFSMRKLAKKLNMTATPIYRYYRNKDELYLSVLMQGFENLYQILQDAYGAGYSPADRLKNVCREYIKFGINNSNFYNIMLVMDVPKFYDYVGTSAEQMASLELEAAVKVRDFGIKAIKESGLVNAQSSEEASLLIIEFICSMHGFISIVNSQIAEYLNQGGADKAGNEMIGQYVDLILRKLQKSS
ncbi:hypothetical protein MASR2M70_01050 [Bacillota bacterium]